MRRAASLAFASLVAAVVALPWSTPLPGALAVDAPEALFSAGRAAGTVAVLAREPRPMGSEASERARAALSEAIREVGPEPVVQEFETPRARGRIGRNVLARVPGREATGAVLLASHYDSVPRSPGAGDDAAGVAAALEALRALLASGPPRNDVILFFSDGEELGLLGARAFAEEHPWAREVSIVINLDAIGNAGPALLFETGPGNGAVARAFARAVRSPSGGSFAEAVYRRMPVDTDFSVFRDRGLPGANLALAGNGGAYHAWFDTPERLSPPGLQHLGELALDLLRELAEADLREPAGSLRHLLVLPGGPVLHWPAGWSRPLAALAALALAAAGLASLRRRGPAEDQATSADLARALAAAAGIALLAALAAAALAALALLVAGAWRDPRPPSSAGQVHLRLWIALVVATLTALAALSRLARRASGRALLAALPAAGAMAWLALLLACSIELGDKSLPLIAAAAFPSAAATALFPRTAPALLLPLASALLAAPSVQVAIQVASASPTAEFAATALLSGAGILLVSPSLARLSHEAADQAAPSPSSRSIRSERKTLIRDW